MKKIIVAVALLLAASVGAYKAHTVSVHNSYVAGCSRIATSFLSLLGVPATDQEISDKCNSIATEEGY